MLKLMSEILLFRLKSDEIFPEKTLYYTVTNTLFLWNSI